MADSALDARDAAPRPDLPDDEVVRRVVGGETALFELIMRRHNARVYRAVRSVLRDEGEVEDCMQQAYVAAWRKLATFEGRAKVGTWLVRIAINEALMKLRQGKAATRAGLEGPVRQAGAQEEDVVSHVVSPEPGPEEQVSRKELAVLVERVIDELPDLYRTAVVLRELEGMSTREVAEALEVTEEAVKTRLHRGKALVREKLLAQAAQNVFAFHATRCDRVVAGVMASVRASLSA